MPSKPRGRPPKKRRNLAHLQKGSSSSTILPLSQGCPPVSAVTEAENDVPIGRSQGTGQLPVTTRRMRQVVRLRIQEKSQMQRIIQRVVGMTLVMRILVGDWRKWH
jgi:hypothetical protein